MYPFIKVKKETSAKFFCVMVSILVVLTFIWWFLTAMQTQLNSYIITNNTYNVQNDDTKIKVEHINEDGDLYLEDTTKILDSDVSEYIMTEKGTGTYYIPDNKMSRELTESESLEIGESLIFLTAVVYIISILLLVNCKGNKLGSVLVDLLMCFISIVTLVVMEYYVSNILQKDIPVQEIVVVAYILFALSSIMLRKFRRRIWK